MYQLQTCLCAGSCLRLHAKKRRQKASLKKKQRRVASPLQKCCSMIDSFSHELPNSRNQHLTLSHTNLALHWETTKSTTAHARQSLKILRPVVRQVILAVQYISTCDSRFPWRRRASDSGGSVSTHDLHLAGIFAARRFFQLWRSCISLLPPCMEASC